MRHLLVASLLLPLAFASLHATASAQTPTIQRHEIRTLVQMFENLHYSRASVTDRDGNKLVSSFLDKLDPEHSYYLQRDVDQLVAKHGAGTFTDLRFLGQPKVAEAAQDLLKERVATRTAWIKRQVRKMASTHGGAFQPLTPEPPWADQPKTLDERWQQLLVNEWMLAVAQGKTETSAIDDIVDKYQSLATYIDQRTKDDTIETLLNSYASLYDTHSRYFSPRSLAALTEESADPLVGVGASLEYAGYHCIFSGIIPGGPAERAGIQRSDRLVGIQVSDERTLHTMGRDLSTVVAKLRGPKGSHVTLLVERPHSLRTDTITVTREHAPALRAGGTLYHASPAVGLSQPSLAVLTLPSFYGVTSETTNDSIADDIHAILSWAEAKNAKGLVIDLRGNEGGLLLEVAKVAAFFLGARPVVREKQYNGEVKVEPVNAAALDFAKPIVVLVDGATASGAELLAGALQSYNRAVVVGTNRTFGAAQVQAVLNLGNFMPRATAAVGATRLSVSEFFLPSGASPQPNGIAPDVLLTGTPFKPNSLMPRNSALGDTTLPNLSAPDPAWIARLATLRQRSEHRKTTLPEVQYLQRWSESLNQTAASPSGNLEQVRQWQQQRQEDRKRFKIEGAEFRKLAQFQPAAQYDSGYHTSTPQTNLDDAYDVELQEALRILSDSIEMEPR